MKRNLKSLLRVGDFLLRFLNKLGQDIGLHWRDFVTLSSRYQSEGFPFFSKTMPQLAKAMLKALGNGKFILPSSFKRCRKGSEIPAFCGSLFLKVFRHDGTLRNDACPDAILALRQFLEVCYKANLPRKVQDDDAVIQSFVRVEEELAQIGSIEWDPILILANQLTKTLYCDYAMKRKSGLRFKHGPGVTANVPIDQKFDHKLTFGLPVVREFSTSFFFNEEDGMTRLDRYPVANSLSYFKSENCAKVILVPKDSRGPRLISCEPAENQFIQQGIAAYIIEKLESDKLSSGHVNFADQSINRNLAYEHSSTKVYSTLDLKDASDRVSLALVEKVFYGTDLLPDLLTARSSHTQLLDGSRIKLLKHAPMGSALCFPVMAHTIYVLCVSGIMGLVGDLHEAIDSVYVYGDDVVVKTKYAEFVKRVLERYHLRVNADKCFIDSNFLESCGMDAFKSNNVTPIRLREVDIECRKNLITEKPKTLLSLLSTANLLQSKYERAATLLYEFCESWLGPLPYGHQHSPYLSRIIPDEFEEMIPEVNIGIKGIRWYRRKNLQRYPLGCVMEAWRVKPVKTANTDVSIYGHFSRIWGMLGSEDNFLPELGIFTKPRQYVLLRKNFDHYAMYNRV